MPKHHRHHISFRRRRPRYDNAGGPNATAVSPSTYLSFSFNNVPPAWGCDKKLYWLVQKYPVTGFPNFVNVGDFLSNNSNKFKIEKADPNSYKISYCHFGTDNECNNVNVGLMLDPWLRLNRLAVTENPFLVVFKKASSTIRDV